MRTLIWYLTTVMQCDLSLYVPLQILLRKISSYFTEFFPSSLVNGKSVFFTNGILYVGLSNCLSGIYNCILIDRMCKPESIIFDALVWFLQLENYLDSVVVEWRRIQIGLKLVLTIDRLWQTRFSKAFPLSYHQSITIIPKKWWAQTKSFFDFLLRKMWMNLHNL